MNPAVVPCGDAAAAQGEAVPPRQGGTAYRSRYAGWRTVTSLPASASH